MRRLRIRKGLDLPLAGAPAAVITDGAAVRRVGLLGRDYPGLRPRVLVQVGDTVRRGDPLVEDRRRPGVVLTAVGGGVVTEIQRGPRRSLTAIVIELGPEDGEGVRFETPGRDGLEHLDREAVVQRLLRSGLFTALRTRPFEHVPLPDSVPASLFVTAMDTRPLAPSPALIVAEAEDAFRAGLRVLTRLTTGRVFVCRGPGAAVPLIDAPQVQEVEVRGPHPAGLVGTHVHHLDPVGAHKTVWHVGYQDVIAFGRLFLTGRLPVERVISVAGPRLERPRMVRTRLGASVDDLLTGELPDGVAAATLRVVSGSALFGDAADAPAAYLGRYHDQLTVLAEGTPGSGRRAGASASGLFRRLGGSRRPRALTTARHGRPTAMLPWDVYERVLPLDVLPAPLLRSLLVGDVERAEALGCLELAEEDLSLLTYVCPAKTDYGPHLRAALDLLERDR